MPAALPHNACTLHSPPPAHPHSISVFSFSSLTPFVPHPSFFVCTLSHAGYLEYLDSSGRYTTELLRAKYEYEQRWMPDWEPDKEDALSVSLCTASASSE